MRPASLLIRALILALLPLPAAAWQATLGAVCVLTHETDSAALRLTYDPARPLYTIAITRKTAPWPDAPLFEMRFEGTAGLTIGTARHSLSPDGRTLTVTDRGFGNVLDGLQFNSFAHALSGGVTVSVPLAGAAAPVQAFRACPPYAGV